METPNYYAIIPACVRYDKELKANEKLLYGEITALANCNGYCYASNSYFAELYSTSKLSITRWISNLNKKGYIRVEMIYEEGTKNIKERRLYINDLSSKMNIPIFKNDDTPIIKNDDTPIIKNDEDNNTSINNTSINNKKNIKKKDREFLEVIESYTTNDNLVKTLVDYIDHRKEIKSPMTLRAFKMILNKLDKFTSLDTEKIEILNQSIENGWKGIFELKKNNQFNQNRQSGQGFNNFKGRDYSQEQQKELEEKLSIHNRNNAEPNTGEKEDIKSYFESLGIGKNII